MREWRNYVGGRFRPAREDRWLTSEEPATGRVWARFPDSGAEDIADAVEAAKQASSAWRSLDAEARGAWLRRLAAAVEEASEELADLESTDTGKPLALARAVDIPRAVRNLRFFASAGEQFFSEAHITGAGVWNVTLRLPVGVAGCISPWNLPLYLLTWKVAPALAAGNTVVAKPSELTPATASRFAELAAETGLPAGVLNVVHGAGARAGATLVEHPDVAAVSFTGGTETGRRIAKSAAPQFKKISLELGGKNPTLVFDDADLEAAVSESVRAAFSNQGEICLCGSRILVQRNVYGPFRDAFVAGVRRLVVGDPRDPGSDLGALISAAHRKKVEGYIRLALEEGGRILTGGGRVRDLPERCREGYFLEPTVVEGLSADCRVNQEEIFGPVVSLLPFDDENDALQLANGTPYGLAAMVWTRDLSRAMRVASGLDAGIIWVNGWMVRDLRTPFGGSKQSGLGREGGFEALRFFTEPRNVCFRSVT